MYRLLQAFSIAWFMAGPAFAGNSYVLPDGMSRAAAVTLHCATGVGTAVACGTSAQPLVVTPSPGAATSANQATEITAQQSMSQAMGTQSDPIYATGPGSMISLLKGLSSALANGIQSVPVGGQPVSRTLANMPALTSSSLFAVNPSRRYMAFQAPQTTFIWVNFLGGTAGPNLPNCVYFAAGTFYESGSYVNQGTVTVFSPIITTVSAWEG